MALPYKKDLDKYKDLDEDEILNKLSAEELKQLETALEEMDPEVSAREGFGKSPGLFRGRVFFWQRDLKEHNISQIISSHKGHKYNLNILLTS